MEQIDVIKKFVAGAKFYMILFNSDQEEFGKIIDVNELQKMNLATNPIYRSLEYKNDDLLFILDLKPQESTHTDNELQLLLSNLESARLIESVYPQIFRWVYDGLSIKAYAIIPSGNPSEHGTLSRYGGTVMFSRVLSQHLDNIGKMQKGISPDYGFIKKHESLIEQELCIGSVNNRNKAYSIMIDLSMSYLDVLRASKTNKQSWRPLETLRMKYWTREINPDFVSEAKHFKLKSALPIDESYSFYPPCIKALMALKYKGNYNRYVLSRYLLSVHQPQNAKFIYQSILGDEEKEHIKEGNDRHQWNYIMNNMKRYNAPSCREMSKFCDKKCKYVHPLESAQNKMNKEEEKNGNNNEHIPR